VGSNLSAFETFFPEEAALLRGGGAQVFDFGSFGCNFCSNTEGMSGFLTRGGSDGRRRGAGSRAEQLWAHADVPDATNHSWRGVKNHRGARPADTPWDC